MPQNSSQKTKRPPGPPPNGDTSGARSPPDALITYLESHVDSLDVTKEDLADFFEKCSSQVITTHATKKAYKYLQNSGDLLVENVGPRGDSLIILVSYPEGVEIDMRGWMLDKIYIRSGSLMNIHSKHPAEIAREANYDFLINTSDEGAIMAVSDSSLQDPSTLLPTLHNSDSVTTLTVWISRGEEEMVIDRDDYSIIDFNVRSFDQNAAEASIQNSISVVDDGVISKTSHDMQKRYDVQQHVQYMIDGQGQNAFTRQIPFNAISLATVILTAIFVNKMLNLIMIGQIAYYTLVMGSFLLLIGGMIYEDFIKE